LSRFRGQDGHTGHESNAEAQLLIALQNAYGKLEINERPFTDVTLPLRVTRPDFWFPGAKVAVYLDGPHHSHNKVAARDEEIDSLLEKQGIKVLRLPYRPPLSKTNQGLFLAVIRELVNREEAK